MDIPSARGAFSKGDRVTAQDVKFSLDRFRDPRLNVIIPSLASGFTGVSVLNPRRVHIHLQHPGRALLENMTVFQV